MKSIDYKRFKKKKKRNIGKKRKGSSKKKKRHKEFNLFNKKKSKFFLFFYWFYMSKYFFSSFFFSPTFRLPPPLSPRLPLSFLLPPPLSISSVLQFFSVNIIKIKSGKITRKMEERKKFLWIAYNLMCLSNLYSMVLLNSLNLYNLLAAFNWY